MGPLAGETQHTPQDAAARHMVCLSVIMCRTLGEPRGNIFFHTFLGFLVFLDFAYVFLGFHKKNIYFMSREAHRVEK